MLSIIMGVKGNLQISRMAIESVLNNTRSSFELIVVDNGSDAHTTEYLEKLGDKIKHVYSRQGLGWCKAINTGLKEAKGDYVCFANNDIVLTPDWDTMMLEHFNIDPLVGVMGPITNKVEGYQHVDHNKEGVNFQYADVLTFFFVVVRRSVIDKIGGLDEKFDPGGQDDADYCIRARQAGWKIGIARDVFIYHYGSATFRKVLNHNIQASQKFAESRVDILRNKYRDVIDSGVRKRIFICVPNLGQIIPELATNLIAWSHDPRYAIKVYMPKNIFPLDAARNHCVNEFLEGDYDYLWWIDEDIVPPLNAMHRLIMHDKDIVGAVAFAMEYKGDVGFPYPVSLRYNKDKRYEVYYPENGEAAKNNGLVEIDATGGACLIFKRKVYEVLERPYEFQYHKNGTLALTCDFDIFQKAQKAGFKLWMDFGLICDHIRSASLKSFNNMLIRKE